MLSIRASGSLFSRETYHKKHRLPPYVLGAFVPLINYAEAAIVFGFRQSFHAIFAASIKENPLLRLAVKRLEDRTSTRSSLV